MARIGYHCSHEQFTPSDLLQAVQNAEQAGFEAAMCSDHFYPWSERQGQSGYSFSWLGAALQATRFSLGVVCAPGQRQHPVIVAQAAATLAAMFPRRFWMALGSGQYLNEHITGEPWPPKAERNARLRESVDIMRALFAGELVTNREGHIRVDRARLYTLPERPPMLLGAAVTAETAGWLASWADGLITIAKPLDEMKKVVSAFHQNGGEGKPMFLQAQVSYHPNESEARRAAHDQWRNNLLDPRTLTDLAMPEEFDREGESIGPDDLQGDIRISSDLRRHVEWLQQDIDLGFEAIYIHNVGRNQQQFIDAFGQHVLPLLAAG